MRIFLTLLIILAACPVLWARDIDVDRIYLDSTSLPYKIITRLKERSFSILNADTIDENTVFSAWPDRDTLIYIKETGDENRVYSYSLKTRKKENLLFFKGALTFAEFSEQDSTLFIKSFNPLNLDGKIIIYQLNSAVKREINTTTCFRDFTILDGQKKILLSQNEKILIYDYNNNTYTPAYSKISGNYLLPHPLALFPSPDGRQILAVSGEGGSYSSMLFEGERGRTVTSIKSNLDIKWIDNRRFIARSGSPGNYSVIIHDSKNNSEKKILSGTLNPSISVSPAAGMITFLKDQILNIYSIREGKITDSLFECEDAYFSPDRKNMSALYLGKLYLIKYHQISQNSFSLRRNTCRIHDEYEKIKKSDAVFTNSYSGKYVERKSELYKRLCKGSGL